MGANGSSVVIRRATPADAPAVAEVWLDSFRTALPMVRPAHTDDEVRAWVAAVLIPDHETWVATIPKNNV